MIFNLLKLVKSPYQSVLGGMRRNRPMGDIFLKLLGFVVGISDLVFVKINEVHVQKCRLKVQVGR